MYNNFIVLSLTKIKTNGLQQKGTKSPYKVVPQIIPKCLWLYWWQNIYNTVYMYTVHVAYWDYRYIWNDLQLGKLKVNCFLFKLNCKFRKMFLSPSPDGIESQPSDLRWDALTTEIPGLLQRAGYGCSWRHRTAKTAVLICL